MFEWLRKLCYPTTPEEHADWVISIPDGHADTASVSYKGQKVPVRQFMLEMEVGAAATLHLELHPRSLEVVLRLLDQHPAIITATGDRYGP